MIERRRNGIRLIGIALATLMLAACATAPVQDMSNARQAVVAAKQAGAAQVAPAEWHSATQYLQAAERALDHHHFDQARVNARLARKAAIDALEKTRQAEQRASDASSAQ